MRRTLNEWWAVGTLNGGRSRCRGCRGGVGVECRLKAHARLRSLDCPRSSATILHLRLSSTALYISLPASCVTLDLCTQRRRHLACEGVYPPRVGTAQRSSSMTHCFTFRWPGPLHRAQQRESRSVVFKLYHTERSGCLAWELSTAARWVVPCTPCLSPVRGLLRDQGWGCDGRGCRWRAGEAARWRLSCPPLGLFLSGWY